MNKCDRCQKESEKTTRGMCCACYEKERRTNPKVVERKRLSNRKQYYKKRSLSIPNQSFNRSTKIKSRKERNTERLINMILATPKWLDFSELKNKLVSCPDHLSVDHIIPLNRAEVCGLNVPWNLQFVTPEENRFKKAKFDGTYENESWREKFKKP